MDQKLATKQKVVISVFGNAGVGKTCLVERFCTETFYKGYLKTTLGLDSKEKTIRIHGEEVHLSIWDSAGQERYSDVLPSSYFQKSQGVLLVYSIDDRKSFKRVGFWMKQVCEKAPKNVIKILVASKCDSEDVKVTTEEGVRLAEMYRIKFVKTSSKEGVGVNEPFETIVEEFLEQRYNQSTFQTMDEKAILNHLDIDDIKTVPKRSHKSQRCCLLC